MVASISAWPQRARRAAGSLPLMVDHQCLSSLPRIGGVILLAQQTPRSIKPPSLPGCAALLRVTARQIPVARLGMRSVAIDGEMLGLAFGAMGHHMPDERVQLNSDEAEHLGAGERGDFILATYREIAAHFSLGGPNAARTKVKRAGWSAEPSNHPADPLHIRVPRDTWYQAADTAHPRRAERPHITENGETSQQFDTPDLKRPYLASSGEATSQPDTPHITALEGHIASLQADLAAERARADQAEQARAAADARVDATMARADAANADRRAAEARAERAEQGRDAERARADALRDRLTTMQEQLANAHGVLQTAAAAEARIEQAERDRERAEQGRDAERARADALRERIDGSERDRAAAVTIADEAVRAAEALRQTEDARKGRGRLARLRAAWRGE